MANTSIFARLGLNTQQFTTGLATARASARNFATGVGGQFAAAAGIAGMGAMVRSGIELGEELTNLSAIAGVSVEDFQTLAYAAETVGVDMDSLSDIYKDMNDRVGDYLSTGGGPMLDFFENIAPLVGVTAEEFRGLSGPDALQLYYDTLVEANASQADMTFYMEAIASDATALIPLLASNGAGFAALGAEAKEAGAIMSTETASAMSGLNDDLGQMKTRLIVTAATITGNVLPVFTLLRSGLGFIGETVGYMGAAFYAALELIGNSTMTVVQPAITAFQGLAAGVEGTWHALNRDWAASSAAFDNAATLGAQAREEFVNIPSELGDHWTDYENQVNTSTELMGQAVEDRAEEVQGALDILSGAEAERKRQLEQDRAEQEALAEEAAAAESARLAEEMAAREALAELETRHHEDRIAMAGALREEALDAAQAYWTDEQFFDWLSLEEAAAYVEDAAESMETSTSGLSDAASGVVDAVNQLNQTMYAPPSEWQWLAQRQDQIITHLESIDTEVNRNP